MVSPRSHRAPAWILVSGLACAPDSGTLAPSPLPPEVVVEPRQEQIQTSGTLRPIFHLGASIRVLVPGARDEWRLELDPPAAVIPSASSTEDGRLGLEIRNPSARAGPARLFIRRRGELVSTFSFEWRVAPGELEPIRQARIAFKNQDRKRGLQILREGMTREDGWTRLWSQDELFKQAYQSGDMAGAIEEALRTTEHAQAIGVASLAKRRRRAAGTLAIQIGDYERAGPLLIRSLCEATTDLDRGRVMHSLGWLHMKMGRLRDAERVLRHAVEIATRLGHDDDRIRYAQVLGVTLAIVGRFREAETVLARHRPEDTTSEEIRAQHASNRAWLYVLEAFAGNAARGALIDQAEAEYELALAGFEKISPPQAAYNQRIRLAWLAVQQTDIARAEQWLTGIPDREDITTGRWLMDQVLARIELQKGDTAEAIEILNETLEHARRESAHQDREVIASLLYERGRARLTNGETTEGLDDLREAASKVDALGQAAFLRSDASSFLARKNIIRSTLVEHLADSGLLEEALQMFEQGRARLFDELRAAALTPDSPKWSLSHPVDLPECLGERTTAPASTPRPSRRPAPSSLDLDPLRARLKPNAAVLVLFEQPTPPSVPPDPERVPIWRSLWLDKNRLATNTSTNPLTPWKSDIQRASRIYLVSDDLRWLPRMYRLYPPDRPSPIVSLVPSLGWLTEPEKSLGQGTLLVANPDGSLQGAQEEGRYLHDLLDPAVSFVGHAPPKDLLLQKLTGAELFHFAGHGELVGNDPWETRLVLKEHDALTLDDILFHRPRLRLAMFIGCRTGDTRRPYAIGLPQAFLLSGSRTVVATVNPIRDKAASRFVTRFYENDGRTRPGHAFRRAVMESRLAGDPVWKAFRLWGAPKS